MVAILLGRHSAYTEKICAGIARYMRTHGRWRTMVARDASAGSLAQAMQDWEGQGVVYLAGNAELEDQIQRLDVPAVVIADRNMPAWPNPHRSTSPHGCIGPDLERIGTAAAEHLLDRGLQRFGYLGNPAEPSGAQETGFRRRIQAEGRPYRQFWPQFRTENWQRHRRASAQWLASLDRPVGLLCMEDNQARMCIDICRVLGIHVPEQIAVIGVGNDPALCDLVYPSVSSVDLNGERIGYEAAGLLDASLRGDRPPDTPLQVEPGPVVARLSTAIEAVEDPVVAQAMAYIRQNIDRNLSVSDVVNHLLVSRRNLEQRFARALGRTPGRHIRAGRIRRCRQLLRAGDLSIEQVARRMHFASAKTFSIFLKRATGHPPSHFLGLGGR
jgi:LacI family transcriptional regulator